MTWSLIAKDKATGRVGIVVATKFFAVGAMVPHIKTGVGAVATQAFINPHYGPRALAMMTAGADAETAVKLLTAADAGSDNRQVHVMDKDARCAAFTGSKCVDWCGHTLRDGFSVAGNMLAGPAVLNVTADTYEKMSDLPFARRLIRAMQAGEAAGGDKRGKQSAALLIHDDEEYPLLDLRVDDHADPLSELTRLESVARERWVHFRRSMPRAAEPAGLLDRSKLDELIAASVAENHE